MPIIHDFEYVKVKTLREALQSLKNRKNAMILAGGTDLVGHLKEGAITPSLVVDIKGLKELKKIEIISGRLHIGSLVTFSDLIESKLVAKKLPVLLEIAKNVASPGIRNRATLIGNICSAVPCLDSGPLLVALEGMVHLKGGLVSRKVPAEKWFLQARKTARRPNELVTGVSIPLSQKKSAACYVKLGRYQGEDLAQASVFVQISAEKTPKYRVAFGSVAPIPKRAHRIERAINSRKLDSTVLEEARVLVAAEVNPITDIRATKEYRLHMCEVMLARALVAAQERLQGQGPAYGVKLI